MKLKIPTPSLVRRYNKKFEADDKYRLADKAIRKVFDKFGENKNIPDIWLKISIINDLYSTNIFATFEVAKHILSLDVDAAIKKGEPGIVNKIAKITISNKKKNFYSFATKYCNWHNQSKYPIYDGFVDKILRTYRNETEFYDFKNAELRDYVKFLEILDKFKTHFKLSEFDFKKMDKFLWMYSKEVFKKK